MIQKSSVPWPFGMADYLSSPFFLKQKKVLVLWTVFVISSRGLSWLRAANQGQDLTRTPEITEQPEGRHVPPQLHIEFLA